MKSNLGTTSKARPGFRSLAGILSVLFFLIGVPVTIFMAIHGSAFGWLDVFIMVFVGAAFASVAYSGRWLCFRKHHD